MAGNNSSSNGPFVLATVHSKEIKSYLDNLTPAKRLLARPSEPEQNRLFSNCCRPTLFGLYRHEGQWYLCRVRSRDCDGTYTIVWEDGTLQIGTTHEELLRPATEQLKLDIEASLAKTQLYHQSTMHSSGGGVPGATRADSMGTESSSISGGDDNDDIDVWEAAKRGDMETVLRIIDSGEASPNDVELLDEVGTQGRTPLYWACFIGHVELVRELLARGGIDYDGSAYLAVTSREKADDERDLMFNPDDEIYSDWVDYDPKTNATNDKESTKTTREDDTALIRAMLLANQSRHNKGPANMPTRLYKQASKDGLCVVCLEEKANAQPVPCGHIACCMGCLTRVRDNRDGCPICRGRLVAIVERGNTTS